jgi:hypothetical protein
LFFKSFQLLECRFLTKLVTHRPTWLERTIATTT